MHLLEALQEFSIKRKAKIVFPEAKALTRACADFKAAKGVAEESNQRRIQRVLALFSRGQASDLHRRDIRFVASAIGSNGLRTSAEVDLVLNEVERRHDPSLFRAVFSALLAAYRNQDLRQRISAVLGRHLDNLHPATRNFIERSGIITSDDRLQTFAARLASSHDIYGFCIANCIDSHILLSNYGTELKLAILREVVKLPNEVPLKNFLDWIFDGISGTPIGDYYEAMLTPFQTEQPPPNVQRILMNCIVEKFKDPRIHIWPIPFGRNGEARRDACVSTLRRWLSIEYLDLFIKVIESTAVDRQFKPRKNYWLNYFENDKISDVTLVLASDADKIVRKMRTQVENADFMQWAKLNQALGDQSVLLMRIGDLIIAEWSHNGAMRFWKATDKHAPQFHLREYLGSQLRNGSLKVKVGNVLRDSIIHHENGDWMRWATNTIKYYTNVTI